jgi:hypothetical protein
LVPLWEEGISDWTKILESRTTSSGQTQLQIFNVTTIHAKLHSGDKPRPHPKLDMALSILAARPILPASHEHTKLPKPTTTNTQTIHYTWHKYINQENLPTTKASNYETITTHTGVGRSISKRRRATRQDHTYTTPSETIKTTYDVLEIQDHRRLHSQTTYLITQWSPEILTQEQIYTCTKEGFTSKHIHPLYHIEGRPLYEVHWRPTWQLDSTIMDNESGPTALQAHKQRTHKPRQVKRRTPPVNPAIKEGWRSANLTFSTTPINPDLDIHPTNRYELT